MGFEVLRGPRRGGTRKSRRPRIFLGKRRIPGMRMPVMVINRDRSRCSGMEEMRKRRRPREREREDLHHHSLALAPVLSRRLRLLLAAPRRLPQLPVRWTPGPTLPHVCPTWPPSLECRSDGSFHAPIGELLVAMINASP
jgi:hypothetical protein